MRSILIITSAIVILSADAQEKRTNYLRNFYKTNEDHEKNAEQFRNLALPNVTHKIRHKHDKVKRCKRYAQIYYQNYVPRNCYYSVCRQSYCGYCPTSNCRRRCPYGCTTPVGTTTPKSTRYTIPTIRECNCDIHGSKIQACDQNTGKCICKPHYEGTKCDQCEAGYWKSKSVCKPCNCNYNGATSLNCNAETGMCPCKPGVQGQRCDSCQEKHYGNVTIGCKACEPCEKEGHICHPENGKCVCPELTRGQKCEQCVENAWGHEPGIGCKPCGCSITGSSASQCDSVTGRCTCRLGFEREKCDKCSFGYYNYPNCRKCNCALAGTRPEDCSHGTCRCTEGGCRCKANVEGHHCDRCKKGTFGMDSEHPEGCIPCFCSNRSTTCTASTYIWHQIRMSDSQNPTDRDCFTTGLCWILPGKFNGDLMQSYGGYLRISSNSPRNSVYLTGNGVTLESVTDPRGDIRMTETFWKLKDNGEPPRLPYECVYGLLTRSCFMVVLQNVTKIRIEPSSGTQNLNLDEVLLDTVSNTRGISQAKSVEQCVCPENYASSSCQDPNTGFYRYYPKPHEPEYDYIGRNMGIAKPCQCNNKSKTCNKQTGHCLDCQDYTTGPHCEWCAEGYYMDPRGNCSPCLCPSEDKNFARNCTVTRQGFTCICKEGYSGKNCNRCGDKYWGNPEAVGGFCQPCNCNTYGSEDLRCDKVTGHCKCKPGFVGKKCSKCSSPRQVIQDGVCIPCDECTQILFHTLDDLSVGVDNTLDLFKNGIGPPWGLFNSTVYRYELLTDRFDNLEKAKKIIRDANIPRLENRIGKMKQKLRDRGKILDEQMNTIDSIQKETANTSKTVHEWDDKINDIIENVEGFGKSHVNVHEALRQAEELLNDIVGISKEAPSTKYYQDFFNKCQKVYVYVNETYRDDFNSSAIKADLDSLRNRVVKFGKVLDRTEITNKLARNKNKQNNRRLDVLKRSISEIHDRNMVINKNMLDILKKINATNDLLQDMTKIYETLAQIDLEDTTKKLGNNDVNRIFDVLPIVREHVRNLQNKIKTYKSLFNFTAEDWKKIDASGAYERIVKGIQEAKKQAEEARNFTINALKKLYPSDDDSLPDKTNLAKAFSDRIKKRIMNLENLTKDFRKISDELEDLKDSILSNGKSNNELNSVLRQILDNVTEQSENMRVLEKAKSNARNASSLIAAIDQGIKDINITMQHDLNRKYDKYLDLISHKEISDLKEKINKTRVYIDRINITVFDKIKAANKDKLNATKGNIGELEKQISRLQNIIQYANERVESLYFGVNLTNCERSYNLNKDILRSLEVGFKKCKGCVLLQLFDHKNETIRLSYENNEVHVTWRNRTARIAANRKVTLERKGVKIEIKNETGQRGVFIKDDELYTPDRLQLGDLNSSVETCIDKVKLNGQTVGLWKFSSSQGTCAGYVRNTSNDDLSYVFFNGEGYRKISRDLKEETGLKASEFSFIFIFATFDENSLIFLSQDKTNPLSFIIVRLKDGHLQLNVNHTNGDKCVIISNHTYNNGVETNAEISLKYNGDEQTYSLKVGEENIREVKKLERKNVYRIKRSEVFVGGVPSINRSSIVENTNSFLGNLRVVGSLLVTNQNSLSHNIEPRLTKLEFYKAWFSGKGYVNLEFSNSFTEGSEIVFTLKPVSVDDNFVMNINDELDIYLNNSSLILKAKDTPELTFGSVCANSSNLITVKSNSVKVNDEEKNTTLHLEQSEKGIRFYLGNYTTNTRPNFVGTISDIFLDHDPSLLNGTVEPLLFDATSVKSFATAEIGRDRITTTKDGCVKEMQNTERYFTRPVYKTEPQAFKFGDKPNSFVFIKNLTVGKKFVLEFQFRTFYPNGLLFYANSYSPNRSTTFYTVVEIQGGDVRLRVQGHKTKVMNLSKKINDGTWHHMQVEQIMGKKKWRFVVKVDKKWKVKERIARNSFNGGIYIGGVSNSLPVHKKLKNDLHPLRGCIRSLKINRNLQVVKNNNNVFYSNIGQCFQNVEEGAYFGGDAFAVYKYDFKVNNFLELSFEFKTGETNGVLLSVSNLGNSPALSVELQNGAVVMTIDMGNGIVSKVTNSPHSDSTLADNEWHNITALYSSSELTVNVDGIRKSWVQSDINSMMDAIEAPLYIGGLPSNAPSGTLKIKENFRGCIRKFKIEDNIMDWTDMRELNNVQLNSCLA